MPRFRSLYCIYLLPKFHKWSQQIAKASRGGPRSKSIFMTVNIMSKLMQLVDYIGQT